ncbi:MAG: ATP-binding protein [Bacteroidia bacterium]
MEFKASFDRNTKNAIVKSIGAFMNNKGGTIIIGVHDKGAVHGLSINDGWELDKISREISQAVRANLVDESFIDLISIDTKQRIGDKRILRIDCASSDQPVFFSERDKGNIKKEIFYLRIGTENQKLEKVSQIVKAIRNRDSRSVEV